MIAVILRHHGDFVSWPWLSAVLWNCSVYEVAVT